MGGRAGGKGQGGKQRSLSEIKLLKLLQEDLNVRVMQNQTKIDEATRAGIDIAPLLLERGRLATEQGELASWTFDLLATDPQDGSREP